MRQGCQLASPAPPLWGIASLLWFIEILRDLRRSTRFDILSAGSQAKKVKASNIFKHVLEAEIQDIQATLCVDLGSRPNLLDRRCSVRLQVWIRAWPGFWLATVGEIRRPGSNLLPACLILSWNHGALGYLYCIICPLVREGSRISVQMLKSLPA